MENAPVVLPIEGKALRRIAMMNVVDLFPDLKGTIDSHSYQEIEILEAQPQKRTIRVKPENWGQEIRHYYVGLPYLQFVRYLNGFFVAASKRSLTVEDVAWEPSNLLMPPLPNIYSDGHVCLSKAKFTLESTEQAIELFWHAAFTPEEHTWGGLHRMYTLYGSWSGWEKKTRKLSLKHLLDDFESNSLSLRSFCISEAAREGRRRRLATECASEALADREH
jgi:hypothetical protein